MAGDALGNAGLDVPLAVAIAIALIAAAAYLTARPATGIALAFIAIAAAATVPVTGLLEPRRGSNTLYRLADDSKVTIEGVLVREPERADGGRTYLQVQVERAGAAAAAPVTRRTAVGSDGGRAGYGARAGGGRDPRDDSRGGAFHDRRRGKGSAPLSTRISRIRKTPRCAR